MVGGTHAVLKTSNDGIDLLYWHLKKRGISNYDSHVEAMEMLFENSGTLKMEDYYLPCFRRLSELPHCPGRNDAKSPSQASCTWLQ
jgi:hypothetical protein